VVGVDLLDRARRAGLVVLLDGDRLVVRGPKRLQVLASEVIANKPAISIALHHEVDWRTDAMHTHAVQAVSHGGPLPFMVSRDTPPPPGCCLSCGDPLPRPHAVRCAPCGEAARRVVRELYPVVRES